MSFFTDNLLWKEGLPLVGVLSVLLLVCFFYSRIIFSVVLVVFIAVFLFFRSPERVCQEALHNDAVIICPADGKVLDVQFDPASSFDGYAYKVSIFLSVFDVHVQWIPSAGIVENIVYTPGQFFCAFLPKSSLLNERNDMVVRRDFGNHYRVRQIAGTIARRIVCWVNQGDKVFAGQKYGMIKFGSRVEIFLPDSVQVKVGVGQRVYGGKTVLGLWI